MKKQAREAHHRRRRPSPLGRILKGGRWGSPSWGWLFTVSRRTWGVPWDEDDIRVVEFPR